MALDPTDEVGSKILTAFPAVPSTSTWRSVPGIAKASGLSTTDVAVYIDTHPDLFERSPLVVSGTVLYRPAPEVVPLIQKSTGK